MKPNTEKLRDEALAKLDDLIEDLHKEGVPERKIVRICQDFIQNETERFYRKKREPTSLNEILVGKDVREIINALIDANNADSRAETFLLALLQKHDIPHKFQYQIAHYRADFLICEDLIVELDGPQHDTPEHKAQDDIRDAWFKKMGYRILRVPLWTFTNNPEAVIDQICYLTSLPKREWTETPKTH